MPVLKADDTLPKVTQIVRDEALDVVDNNNLEPQYTARSKRDLNFTSSTYRRHPEQNVRIDQQHPFPPAGLASLATITTAENGRLPDKTKDQRRPRKFCDGGGV